MRKASPPNWQYTVNRECRPFVGHRKHRRLVGRGVGLFGIVLLVLNFLDGLYKLARLEWHVAYQIVMTLVYVALSVRLIQLILAFRGD